MTVPEPLEPGEPEALSPRVRRVLAPNPGVFTGPGTNTYLVGYDRVVVIDPGPDHPRHLDAVAEAGRGRIAWILVTHTHPDHAPGAAGLARRTGAPVLGFGPAEDFRPDHTIGEGWALRTDELRLAAVHTPGHASNHLCYLLEDEGLLFSGDQVMNGSTVVIRPPDGDMTAYLAALGRLQAWRPALRAIAPGHGSLIQDPAAKLEAYLAHRRAREDKVVAALAALGPAPAAELVPAVYDDVDPRRHDIARWSLWAHLRKLGAEGRACSDDPDDPERPWRALP